MQFKKFMQKYYNGLMLWSNTYHYWHTGIHVELGHNGGIDQTHNDHKRSLTKFHILYQQVAEMSALLFKETDEVIVVVNSYPYLAQKTVYPNFFRRYVKDQKKKYKVRLQDHHWQYDEDTVFVQQMELFCKVSDLKLALLLKTCIHEDFRHQSPRLNSRHSMFAPDVFLINVRTKSIFHLYDDRGCEIMNVDRTWHKHLVDYLAEWDIQTKP
ncbi:DUF3885 domain-containing protein [Lysinibacillus piscis]|uniref:DUF3885 domain-containing protein n=1 Tax=Lysinibacillus piscis TaxID=2518931 RepID=A0ABQ5NL46_9BACI|nr:hypothetical protein [Lysinibacillus sp. KH24]GLC88821.1 hypothetical protein LYSBPC_19480 [Lysinibacillus sp. KH24]